MTTNFLSRSERGGVGNPYENHHVGPGSYEDPRQIGAPKLPGFIPFGTSGSELEINFTVHPLATI